MIIQVLSCLFSVLRNIHFLPYWSVRSELFLRTEQDKQKPVPSPYASKCSRGLPVPEKKSCSHMKQSSTAAEVDTAGRNVFQRLPLTWQVRFWIRPSTVCTMLSLAQIRCLIAQNPYSITSWQLNQDHYFLPPMCPPPSASFSFLVPFPLLLCSPRKGRAGPSNTHPAVRRAL